MAAVEKEEAAVADLATNNLEAVVMATEVVEVEKEVPLAKGRAMVVAM